MIVKLKIVLLFVLLLSAVGWAKYSGGSGEPNDPYLIATPEDLNSIGLDTGDWNKHFLMTADINMAGITGTQFNIIGNDSNAFTGVFDGNGHTISNFSYNDTSARNSVGMFGFVKSPNALIHNIVLKGSYVYVNGGITIGGLVGMLEAGKIKACSVSGGNVSGLFNIGGLVGFNDHEGIILGCSYSGLVSGSSSTGGLVGFNNNDAKILVSRSTVSVSGDLAAGGLVGTNEGTVENCYSSGQADSNDRAGGLLGNNNGTIINCYSTVEVSGIGYVGALIGADFLGLYSKCFWDSDVNSGEDGIGNGSDPNVIGLPTSELQKRSTFTDAGWDMVNVWDIGENQTYPFLRTHLPSDINKDDQTNFLDFAFLAQNWLKEQ